MPRTGTTKLLGYALPELHKRRSGWAVEYYAVHPEEGKKRMRVKCNHHKDINQRKLHARLVIAEITQKLQSGWRPWHDEAAPKGLKPLGEALDAWDRAKTKQLRHSSPYSYTSMTSVIREWARTKDLLAMPVHAFNRNHAVDFLNYADQVREISNRTYNNYLVFYGMLFSWMKEQGMRTDNPFSDFAKRKNGKKSRTYLTEADRREMAEWIAKNDPAYWLAVLFVYGTLIRPGELRRLRVHHVDLERQVVFLPAEETKSGDERTPAIPDWMKDELVRMELHKQPGRSWLIGSRIVPGDEQVARNTLNRHWVRMRKALGWPASKQLYSLRDTGIIQLIRDGVDLLNVKQQAGHADLSTTNEYVKHAFPNGPAQVKERATSLQASSPIVGVPLFRGELEAHGAVPRFEDMERARH